MPIKREVNTNFFKTWSRDMAYVLGFFAADGSMLKNNRDAHFIEFHVCDKDLLESIKKTIGSTHTLSKRSSKNKHWQDMYRLQIGSKEIFQDLLKLGFTQSKTKKLSFPEIPKVYFSDFVRGYFDGDGCISYGHYSSKDRKKKRLVFSTRFTCGDKSFLKNLQLKLRINLKGGSLVHKKNNNFELIYSHNDSLALFQFMYNNVAHRIFLQRKYDTFKEIQAIIGRQ